MNTQLHAKRLLYPLTLFCLLSTFIYLPFAPKLLESAPLQQSLLLSTAPSFQTKQSFGNSLGCTYSLDIGDIDQNGALDVVAGNSFSLCNQEFELDRQNTINLNQTFNRKWGSFPIENLRPVGAEELDTLDTALADFDNDGDLDVFVGNGSLSEGELPVGRQNYIFLNDGTGNFNTTADCLSNSDVICIGEEDEITPAVTAADVNGDGFLDAITSNLVLDINLDVGDFLNLGAVATSTVNIYLNQNGQGFAEDPLIVTEDVQRIIPQFGQLEYSVVTPLITTIETGDINNDGQIDLVTGNMLGGIAVTVTNLFPTEVISTFGLGLHQNNIYINQIQTVPAGTDPFIEVPFGFELMTRSIALGDLNKDGRLDIVVGNGFTYGRTEQLNYIYLNQAIPVGGIPVLSDPIPIGQADEKMTLGIAVGDLNSDGWLDIVTGNFNAQNEVHFNSRNTADLFPAENSFYFNTSSDLTGSIAVADMTNDGAADIIVGNITQNLIYVNDQNGDFPTNDSHPITPTTTTTMTRPFDSSLADLNNDGVLDIVIANEGPDHIFFNDGDRQFSEVELPDSDRWSQAIATADFNSDGFIDIVIGGAESGDVILFNQNGTFSNTTPLSINSMEYETKETVDIEVADFNRDSHIDIVISYADAPNRLYLNNGPLESEPFTSFELISNTLKTSDITVGDIDGDSDIDIVVANLDPDRKGFVLLNDGSGQFAEGNLECDDPQKPAPANVICFGRASDGTMALELVDVNGDGLQDLIAGNFGQQNKIYVNTGGVFGDAITYFGSASDMSNQIEVADMNGDGFMDLVVANGYFARRAWGDYVLAENAVIYFNDGLGNFFIDHSMRFGANSEQDVTTLSLAVGDLDGNGSVDVMHGEYNRVLNVIYNRIGVVDDLSNNPPYAQIFPPKVSLNTDSGTSPVIINSQAISVSVPYVLYDDEGDNVGRVQGYYSLDGGDNWQIAEAISTSVVNLQASPTGITHTYNWDHRNSDFWGSSDEVVFRIEAYAGYPENAEQGLDILYQNRGVGTTKTTYSAAATYPFRVSGNQIQVVNTEGISLTGAIVYRVPADGSQAQPLVSSLNAEPLTTDLNGFLQGRGIISDTDQLIAFYPITTELEYTIYHLSTPVTENGHLGSEVVLPGIQVLTATQENSLTLFNLVVSLEWDARSDEAFMTQLQQDLHAASRYLYDLTNGQAALGNIRIFHNKGYWNHADIIIRASNQTRPSASLGGFVSEPISETITSQLETLSNPFTSTYLPGQISMPATWNRFGNVSGAIGEDWPRTLVHELGHYLFYLPDNYLGLNEAEDRIILVDCPGVMDDPYIEANSEFRDDDPIWQAQCVNTLANKYLGRADWETIKTFYSALSSPNETYSGTFHGPQSLPLAVTHIETIAQDDVPAPLPAPYFSLVDSENNQLFIPSSLSQAYLIQTNGTETITDDGIIPLGSPVGDKLYARGAKLGDRLCVFDFSQTNNRVGCTTVGAFASTIMLTETDPISGGIQWQPQITITPIPNEPGGSVTSAKNEEIEVLTQTFKVTVTGVNLLDYPTTTLKVQIVPGVGDASKAFTMYQTAEGWVGQVTFDDKDGALYGHVRVWEEGSDPYREIIIEFTNNQGWGGKGLAWGGKGLAWGGKGLAWGGKGLAWGGKGLAWGGKGLAWGGKGLAWGAPTLSGDGQVNVFPLDNLFDNEQAYTLQQLVFPPDLHSWLTPVGQAYELRSEGDDAPASSILVRYLATNIPPGYETEKTLYIAYLPDGQEAWQLLDTEVDTERNHAAAAVAGEGVYVLVATLEIKDLAQGWNNIAYPVDITRTVKEAFAAIDGAYTSIYHHDPANIENPWLLFDTLVADPFVEMVNTLTHIEQGAYWLHISTTEPVSLYIDVHDTRPEAAQAEMANTLLPPMTLYGWASPLGDFTPTVGSPIRAYIDGQLCGETTLQPLDDQLAFVLQVAAQSPVLNQCGTPGVPISFTIGTQLMNSQIVWDNSQAKFVTFPAGFVPVEQLTISGTNTITENHPLMLAANVQYGMPVNYEWQINDGTQYTGQTISHVFTQTGTYTVTATAYNAVSSETKDHVVTVVSEQIPEAISGLTIISEGDIIQLSESFTISAGVETGSDVSYSWSFGDGTAAQGSEVTHSYESVGTYTIVVTASNSLGSETDLLEVQVQEAISGPVILGSGTITQNHPLVLEADVTSGDPVNFRWEISDGTIYTGTTIVHTFAESGNYTVRLEAYNDISSMAVVRSVVVTEVPTLYEIFIPIITRP